MLRWLILKGNDVVLNSLCNTDPWCWTLPYGSVRTHNLCTGLRLKKCQIRNLGFVRDSKLSLKKHIKKTCETPYCKLNCISFICRFLTEDAAKILVSSYILSWLDYCNCLLMSTTESLIQTLQKIQNIAARLVLLAPCHYHSTPFLEKNALANSHFRM